MRRSAIIASSIVLLSWICVNVAVTLAQRMPQQVPKPPLYVESPMVQLPDGRSYRLDWCLRWGTECGRAAADAYCKSIGHSRATEFEEKLDIGRETPTWVLGDKKVCDQDGCDGFKFITCAGK